jgi:hypothetical protein
MTELDERRIRHLWVSRSRNGIDMSRVACTVSKSGDMDIKGFNASGDSARE